MDARNHSSVGTLLAVLAIVGFAVAGACSPGPGTTDGWTSGADTAEPGDEDASADTGDAWTDSGEADGATDTAADTADTADTGRGEGPGLTADTLVGEPWFGMFRLAQSPAVSGTMQGVRFMRDKSVEILANQTITGKWRKFDDNTVLLYDLTRPDGSPNNPEQIPMDANFDNGWVTALEVYVPQSPGGGGPYEINYQRVETDPDEWTALAGDWQSKNKYTRQASGREYRIAVRITEGGKIGYGIYNGTYVEVSRNDGEVDTYPNGNKYWFIRPPGANPIAGEIGTNENGNPVLYALRGINTDGQQGPDEFETVELEPVDSFSL